MTTILHWLFMGVASLMTIGTLLTGLFAWRMWVRSAKPARRNDGGGIDTQASLPATTAPTRH
jgi:hypothetical protein